MSLSLQSTALSKMLEANPYYDYMIKGLDFAIKYNSAFLDASSKAFETFLSTRQGTAQNIQKTIRSSFDKTLRDDLNDDVLASSMTEYIDSWAKLCDLFGYGQFTANLYDLFSYANRILEPLRDNINRTPSDVIHCSRTSCGTTNLSDNVNRAQSDVVDMKGRFNLLHYKSDTPPEHKTPILVVYSLINRHYILDLLPNVSVIKNLQRQGFDIYATDWGTPKSFDKDLALETYAEEYVGNAVEKIKEITGSDKVSLFGYCWGGLFALIYTSTHQENVKNLILHATPVDIDKEKTIIENWTAHLNADDLTNVFGNIPGWLLNLAFLIRNPVEAMLKYPRYFSEPRSRDEIAQFFAIETWLYDSRPIIGEVYRQIIDQVYRNNLLIKNKMKVGQDIINLKNITIPLLDIVGTKDDLVPPSASISIIDAIGSTDKKLIEFPTGHVGLCISNTAHEKLWPEVGKWLAQRS
ncbi:MAG TPA: alpha/beta fold hydrolase [Candidatus Nitrosotalea sp.]|nr:alpha/beta fold hydrolase [Candidatus Nitrosotalea sp.]